MATSFGPYRLLRRIAHGGMGEVYLAVLERGGGFEKTVALKLMLPTVASQPRLRELFESEASVAAMLNHPNIVQIFDHGTVAETTFITMEFVEGPDLSSLIDRLQEPFPPEVSAEIVTQLCRGLSHAHQRRDLHGRQVGVVHGDVSPQNILISREGQAKLADFGLARVRSLAAREGLITGKLSYMSPEQASGRAPTDKSDLYSLGLVLYELLTGSRAHPPRETPTETLSAVRRCDHSPVATLRPDLPEDLCAAVDRALSKSPNDRFDTAQEMSAALTAALTPCGPDRLSEFVSNLAPEAIPSAPLAPEPTEMAEVPVTPKPGSRRWLLWSQALLLTAWSATAAWWLFHTPPTKPPPPPAVRLPNAPKNLTATVIPQPEPKPRKIPRRRLKIVPDPGIEKPCLTITIPKALTARLDHHLHKSPTLAIRDRNPHLLHLRPKESDRPEITLRLSPADSPAFPWRATIRSTPWMQLRLNKRPVGQTPKSRLPLPRGPSTLLFTRDATRIPLSLDIPE